MLGACFWRFRAGVRYPYQWALDADEVAQVVSVQVWLGLPRLERVESFPGWFASVLRNGAIDLFRQIERAREVPLEEVGEGSARTGDLPVPPDVLAEHAQEVRRVAAAIAALPADQRLALLMHLRGDTREQIAHACRVPLGTAKSRVRLAHEKVLATLTGNRT